MVQDLPIAGVEGPPARLHGMRGRRQIVGAMDRWDVPQLPDGSLKPRDQRLETLRGTDHPGLPVRVGQDEVIEEVRERCSVQRDREIVHVREITLGIFARPVDLGKHDLALGPGDNSPAPDAAL